MMEKSETAKRLQAIVEKWALVVAEKPAEQREDLLLEIKATHFQDALRVSGSEAHAKKWSTEVDGFIRTMISIIDTTGGSSGGRA